MKINIGDVVEVKYPTWTNCNGMRFRVEETKSRAHFKGTVVKTIPGQANIYPVGGMFTWSCSEGLVIVKPKEQPTSNQVYIDHIYERLAQNISPQELGILAERLEMLAKQRGCREPEDQTFTEHEFKFKAVDKVMLRPKDHPAHKGIIWNEYYDSLLGKIRTIKTSIGGSITLEEDPLNSSRSAVRFELLQYSPELAKKLNLSFN